VAEGALMFESRFTPEVVEAERVRLGRSGFDGQMQQRPSAAEGEIFTRGHLQLLPVDQLPDCKQIIISLDTAYGVRESNDYSCGIVLGQHDRGFTVLDVMHSRLAFPQLVATVEGMAERWKPTAVLVENKASGGSLIQQLQQHSTLPIRAIQVDRDKVSRANACVPTWEAHRIFAPVGAAWLDDFESELLSFPKAPHDDQCDAFTQAVLYMIQVKPGQGIIDFLKAQIAAAKVSATPKDQEALVNTLPRPIQPGALWAAATRMGGKVSSL
jgi:predicted phage terminase large subunit-like protein